MHHNETFKSAELRKTKPCFSVLCGLATHKVTAVPTFILISGKMSCFIPFLSWL